MRLALWLIASELTYARCITNSPIQFQFASIATCSYVVHEIRSTKQAAYYCGGRLQMMDVAAVPLFSAGDVL